jgi:hypothetical protein
MTDLEKQLFELSNLLEKCTDSSVKEAIKFCFDEMNTLHTQLNKEVKKC